MNRIEVMIPTKDADGVPLDASLVIGWRQRAIKLMAAEFGGCTHYQAFGNWVNERGEIVSERVWLVWSIGNVTPQAEQAITSLCQRMVQAMSQESVASILDNVITLHSGATSET